jgi:preprotein translocase subunit YajC
MIGGWSGWMLLAEAAEAVADAAEPEAPRSPLGGLLLPMTAIALLYFFMFARPQRQKDSAHRTQLDNLKKNDRVVTIGGIYGTVTNIQRDSDEVTLKVDEATNAKLRVTFNAIARIITEDESEGNKAAKT